MALEEYPKIIPADIDSLVVFIQRIVEIRDDDVAQLNLLLERASYNTGFAKLTSNFTSDESIGRTNLYNDIDATGGAITITLDASPIDGQTHYIAKNDASGNAVTVDGNGKNINGSASLALSSQYDIMLIVYMGTNGEWRRWI